MEVWGGLECTINRVGNEYFDQLDYAGHYNRADDFKLFKDLGISKLRYPILWEKHQPVKDGAIDWSETENKLNILKDYEIEPIIGLVHHGSGPDYVNLLDDTFANGLAEYAEQLINRFPSLIYFTPINEPLTTARFCGLYGLWFPHKADDESFIQILINECKATILAMKAIRKVNPDAKLIQTEDLGKTHSTPLLKYQADFENHRRWLAFDLLCGFVQPNHVLYTYLIKHGATLDQLNYFTENACPPDILGFNYYLTSERYLNEDITKFPKHTIGRNKKHNYADVEAVRVGNIDSSGPFNLIKEAWDKYQIPVAITEAHLHCTREEQLRWLHLIWTTANDLKQAGVDIRAVTFWSLLGSFGWNKLLLQPKGDYESGIFDVTSDPPRATLLAKIVRSFSDGTTYQHPVLKEKGWWERDERAIYKVKKKNIINLYNSAPILIIGKSGTLGFVFGLNCVQRNINYKLLDRTSLNILDQIQIESVIKNIKPWAVINTAGYVRVDDAEDNPKECFAANASGPTHLAKICLKYDVKFLTFSSDLVFDGTKSRLYVEKDKVKPLNVYGQSKAKAEVDVLEANPNALIIRTSAFFGPYDQYNFVTSVINTIKSGQQFFAVKDAYISPTYLPDLVDASLNLLLDDECGIWHLSNEGVLTWADLALEVAARSKLNLKHVKSVLMSEMNYKATRPKNSALKSEKGINLPQLNSALDRYFKAI